jgi:acetyl esterase/lipase
MKTLLKILTYISAAFSLLPFLKPLDRSLKTLLWVPKLLAGAFSPIHGIICGLGALLGLVRRDWKLTSAGLIGVGLTAKFIEDIPRSESAFAQAFGADWQANIPAWLAPKLLPVRFALPAKPVEGQVRIQQDIRIGMKPQGEDNLLADLWLPGPGTTPSRLGIVNVHGGGWRVGEKDMFTRSFFTRLASQGHVVLDIAYSLWPTADMSTMVKEINQAILWLKRKAPYYGVDPDKIVLMGGSAGAHLSLLTAYTPGEAVFLPPEIRENPARSRLDWQSDQQEVDTRVCAVVAFYPPVDLTELQKPLEEYTQRSTPSMLEQAADSMMQAIFQPTDSQGTKTGDQTPHQDIISEILGGSAEQIPETYQLLSPISHITPDCPATLLLQGADDVFNLAPGVRRLHARLQEAGVPVVWVEFPHTEHAFDLITPQISPVAQAATYDVERFLAMLI